MNTADSGSFVAESVLLTLPNAGVNFPAVERFVLEVRNRPGDLLAGKIPPRGAQLLPRIYFAKFGNELENRISQKGIDGYALRRGQSLQRRLLLGRHRDWNHYCLGVYFHNQS